MNQVQQTEPDESRGAVVSRRGQKCAGDIEDVECTPYFAICGARR